MPTLTGDENQPFAYTFIDPDGEHSYVEQIMLFDKADSMAITLKARAAAHQGSHDFDASYTAQSNSNNSLTLEVAQLGYTRNNSWNSTLVWFNGTHGANYDHTSPPIQTDAAAFTASFAGTVPAAQMHWVIARFEDNSINPTIQKAYLVVRVAVTSVGAANLSLVQGTNGSGDPTYKVELNYTHSGTRKHRVIGAAWELEVFPKINQDLDLNGTRITASQNPDNIVAP